MKDKIYRPAVKSDFMAAFYEAQEIEKYCAARIAVLSGSHIHYSSLIWGTELMIRAFHISERSVL
jgi:hypothetical protein